MSSMAFPKKVLLLLLVLAFAGCYTPPKPRQPSLLHEAQRRNSAGVDAEARGQGAAAESELSEAYRLYASVENYHGMVTVLINSSRLYRAGGNHEKAALSLKQAEALVVHVPELEAEVSFEATRLALVKADITGARTWAERAVKASADADRGRMYNLLAGVLLKDNDIAQAMVYAENGRKAAINAGNRREEANAQRLLGEAAFRVKKYRDSISSYEAALQIDKDLALAARVLTDLNSLALVYEAAGEFGAAADYLQRAVDSALAAKKDPWAIAELDRLVRLYVRDGRNVQADQASALKKSLIAKRSQ